MDLNNAERLAQKLLQYVNSVATSDNKLYSKSKDRLKSVAETCLQIVEISSDILQTELLEFEDSEFDNKIDSETAEVIDAVNQKTSELKSFVKSDVAKSKRVLKIPNDKVKESVSKYKQIFDSLQSINIDNSTINTCISIICDWMKYRLFTQYENAPPFHYNIYRIKDIIYSIILSYGANVENGTVDEFVEMFDVWFNQLKSDANSNKWIAPFPIYSLERKLSSKSLSEEDVNLSAVLIFEVLWDLGLNEFSKLDDSYGVYLNFRHFWNIVSTANSEVLDEYEYYDFPDSDILSRYNIV